MAEIIAAGILLSMLDAWEKTKSYEGVIQSVATELRAVIPGEKAERILGKALADLGTALQGPQAASPPAARTA